MASADVDITARPYNQDPSAPDPHGPRPGGNAAPPTRDDLDDLFNYDANIGDTFGDVEGNSDAAKTSARQRDAGADADLGIDEEIKIRKPRKPVAKLDEERLLSQNGIPKLRRISKERLRFKGKGHEFTDVQRLLNTYQFWLDDLFPKAKFHDGLAIIEKLGHKKRLKVMRQAWIDEEKPKPEGDRDLSDFDGDFSMQDDGAQNGTEDQGAAANGGGDLPPNADSGALRHDDQMDSSDDEALYRRPERRPDPPGGADAADAGPEEDELDQLMAEDAAARPTVQAAQPQTNPDRDDFADEEEAMAGLW